MIMDPFITYRPDRRRTGVWCGHGSASNVRRVIQTARRDGAQLRVFVRADEVCLTPSDPMEYIEITPGRWGTIFGA